MIQGCISSRAFAAGASAVELADAVVAAGLDAVELDLGEQGELGLDAAREVFESARAQFQEKGVSIASVTSGLYEKYQFSSSQESTRTAAIEITRALLVRALWLGAPVVRVAVAVVGPGPDGEGFVSYENAMSRSYEGLLDVVERAEKWGLKIAICAAHSNFLLSPVETREFVDRLNSSAVGVSLNIDEVSRYGYPVDWLHCLSYRVHCVLAGRVGGDAPAAVQPDVADPIEMIATLRDIDFSGPLIYDGAESLKQIAPALRTLIGQPEN